MPFVKHQMLRYRLLAAAGQTYTVKSVMFCSFDAISGKVLGLGSTFFYYRNDALKTFYRKCLFVFTSIIIIFADTKKNRI